MSYCRFSTNDFQCDVYCYQDCDGGFTIHVASLRYVFSQPLPPPVDISDGAAWFARYRIVYEMVNAATQEPIGLTYDGETLRAHSAASCAVCLLTLRNMGYRVPQHAIDELLAEAPQ